MPEPFDPYHKWLGIPPEEQPANQYRLLGIPLFEADPDVIANAADKQMAHVRSFQAGQHSALSQKVLNEIAAARICLLNAAKKAAYDASLRAGMARTQPVQDTGILDLGFDVTTPSTSSAGRHAHPPKKDLPAWLVPAAVAGAVLVCLGIALVVMLTTSGKKETDQAKQTQQHPSPTKIEPAKPKLKPEQSRPKPKPELPKPEPEQREPEPEPKLKPKPRPAAESPVKAEERLKAGLSSAKTLADYRAIVESGLPVVNRAIDDGEADSVSGVLILLLAAARKTEDDELVKAVTLSLLTKRKADTSAITSSSTDRPPSKQPVPPADAQEKALKLVNEVYKDEFDAAKTVAEKQALAKKMLERAGEAKDDSAVQFVLFKTATDIATQIGDGGTSFQAVDEMAEVFQVDAINLKLGILNTGAKMARLPAHHSAVAEKASAVLDQAVGEEQYDAANQLALLALAAARKGKDLALTKQIQARMEEVKSIAKAAKEVASARKSLEEKPTDPEANLAVGKYKCFVRSDWEKGLPMLALGSDAGVQALASKDLAGAASADAQVALGDAWWEVAETQDGGLKRSFQGRAAYWYRQALPGLSGLTKDKAERRTRGRESVLPAATEINGLRLGVMDCSSVAHECTIGKTFDVRKSWVLSLEASIPNLDPGWHALFIWGDNRPGRDVVYIRLSGKTLEAFIADCRDDTKQGLLFDLDSRSIGKWVKIAFHYDASAPRIRLYVNEKLIKEEKCTVTPTLDRPMPIYLGGANADPRKRKEKNSQCFVGQFRSLSLANVP